MHTSSTLGLFQRQETRPRRPVWSAWRLPVLAGAAAVVAALALLFASQPPGMALRNALVAGGAEAAILPATTKPQAVVEALRPSFRGRTVSIDAEAFPAVVYVTVRALDKETCGAVVELARRIEGLVVIDLDHYSSAADCRDSNDMTWRLMP